MANKKSLKVKCESKSSNQNSASVRFMVPAPEAKAEPGKIAVRSVVTFTFGSEDKALAGQFEPGESYTITIE